MEDITRDVWIGLVGLFAFIVFVTSVTALVVTRKQGHPKTLGVKMARWAVAFCIGAIGSIIFQELLVFFASPFLWAMLWYNPKSA